MIDVKELRSGNFVKLDGIQSDFEVIVDVYGDYGVGLRGNLVSNSKEAISPISLNAEWIKRFGGIWSIHNLVIELSQRILIYFYDGNISQSSIVQDGKVLDLGAGRIKFVHSLQNLAFSLTGQELELLLTNTK